MWPTERTAILVIHGMGQQNPFATLDLLVQRILDPLEQLNPGKTISVHHSLHKQEHWAESRISLRLDGNQDQAVDCYEYYWAHETQRLINLTEVFDWVLDTGVGAQDFYVDNPNLVHTGGPFKSGKFQKYWYLRQFAFSLGLFRLAAPLIGRLISSIPLIAKPSRAILNILGRVAEPFLVDSMGDVAIYTTADKKSQYYQVRQKILNGAVEKARWLLESDEPRYGRVVLIGHSLGSVIAYDVLNRINNQMNAGLVNKDLAKNIKGLATFGSPLDKVAFFFRTRAKRTQDVRKQMLDQYHGFRSKALYQSSAGGTADPILISEIESLLDQGTRWLNFWDEKDPISGKRQ